MLKYPDFDASLAKTFFKSNRFISTVEKILMVVEEQMESTPYSRDGYLFQRNTNHPTDSLMLEGRGAPGRKCGLIRSAFRPSDDATTFPFLVNFDSLKRFLRMH